MLSWRFSHAKVSNGMELEHVRAFIILLSLLFVHAHWFFVDICKCAFMKITYVVC